MLRYVAAAIASDDHSWDAWSSDSQNIWIFLKRNICLTNNAELVVATSRARSVDSLCREGDDEFIKTFLIHWFSLRLKLQHIQV